MKNRLCRQFNIMLVAVITACAMVGCGNAIPEMTEEEQAQICEYAASLLLSHDKNYMSNIMSDEDIAAERERLERIATLKEEALAQKEAEEQAAQAAEAEKDAETSSGDGVADEPAYCDIDEFLELDGINIEYSGYEVCDNYPSTVSMNDWQGVCSASPGNSLVVFYFDVFNDSGYDYYLDMLSSDVRFTFKINGNISKAALTTLLTDDLIMYRGTIPFETSVKTVIVIEMSTDDAQSISSVVMKIHHNGNNAETLLD